MFLEERRRHILKYLNDHERGFVNYFAAYFGVSKETIRSDLNTLSEMGVVQRCYGGAIISRRNLQAELISETGDSFGVLGNDSNLMIVFYVQIMPDDLVMQLHRF